MLQKLKHEESVGEETSKKRWNLKEQSVEFWEQPEDAD